ncbi:MAG: hypothetical protein J0I41_09525 [Filimonas sp.]|nr:hypothetical protein [Filimonas sp.]
MTTKLISIKSLELYKSELGNFNLKHALFNGRTRNIVLLQATPASYLALCSTLKYYHPPN